MSLYQVENRANDRMEKLYLYVRKIEYLLSVFSKEKNVKESLCLLKIRVLHLYVLT